MIVARYDSDSYGYTVIVERDHTVALAEYEAGNCVQESSSVIGPGDYHGMGMRVKPNQLRKWARQTALEMTQEYSTEDEKTKVRYDHSIRESFRESMKNIRMW